MGIVSLLLTPNSSRCKIDDDHQSYLNGENSPSFMFGNCSKLSKKSGVEFFSAFFGVLLVSFFYRLTNIHYSFSYNRLAPDSATAMVSLS